MKGTFRPRKSSSSASRLGGRSHRMSFGGIARVRHNPARILARVLFTALAGFRDMA